MSEDNMPLVYYLIRKHYPTFIGNEDVIQEGMLGLCQAAETYDTSRSNFSTYAGRCILNQINYWFRRNEKHNKHLSLDYTTKNEEGEAVSFLDATVGSEDVDFVDDYSIFGELSEMERTVCELLQMGYKYYEIAEKLGKSPSTIRKIKTKLKHKVRKMNGNN